MEDGPLPLPLGFRCRESLPRAWRQNHVSLSNTLMTTKIPWPFRKRRVATWLTFGLLLGCLFAARANLTVMQPVLRERLGLEIDFLGQLIQCGLVAFGVTSLLAGPLIDRIGGRRALCLGIAGSALCNLLLGASLLLLERPALIQDGQVVLRFGLTTATLARILLVLWLGNNVFQAIGTLAPLPIL